MRAMPKDENCSLSPGLVANDGVSKVAESWAADMGPLSCSASVMICAHNGWLGRGRPMTTPDKSMATSEITVYLLNGC
jgi:hypothetical protein